MMTDEATATGAGVPWAQLQRPSVVRASAPTIEVLNALRHAMTAGRIGNPPVNDAVIIAALRLANRDAASRAALRAEIETVEADTYVVAPRTRRQ